MSWLGLFKRARTTPAPTAVDLLSWVEIVVLWCVSAQPSAAGTTSYRLRDMSQLSLRTPLKGVLSDLPSMKRPLPVSRFTYLPVLVLRVWERLRTAPVRCPLPVLVAT